MDWRPVSDSPRGYIVDVWAKRWDHVNDVFEFKRFPDCIFSNGGNDEVEYTWTGMDDGWRPIYFAVSEDGPLHCVKCADSLKEENSVLENEVVQKICTRCSGGKPTVEARLAITPNEKQTPKKSGGLFGNKNSRHNGGSSNGKR